MSIPRLSNLALVFLLILFCQFSISTKANINGFINNDSIFYHIYNQQYKKAEFELNNSKNSLNPVTYFLLYTDLKWWETLSTNSDSGFVDFEKYLTGKLTDEKKNEKEINFKELICLNYLLRLMAITNQNLKMATYFFRINRFLESFDSSVLSVE